MRDHGLKYVVINKTILFNPPSLWGTALYLLNQTVFCGQNLTGCRYDAF